MYNMSNFNHSASQKVDAENTKTEFNTSGKAVVVDKEPSAVEVKKATTNNDEKKSSHTSSSHDKSDSHKKSSSKHKEIVDGHSFIHPASVVADTFDKDEQKVKCDCGTDVPVSQINRTVVNTDIVGIKAQQSQNVNNTNTASFVVIDESRPKGEQEVHLTVDRNTNPATVTDNGVKSNANLYQHDKAIKDVIEGKNTDPSNNQTAATIGNKKKQ